jgi:murein L,D-transpeptidase YafK
MGIFFFAILLVSNISASGTILSLKDGDSAILIGKTDGLLRVIKNNSGSYDNIKEFFISYGQKKGSKVKEGDYKTPDGVYFATGIKTKQDLKNLPEEIYGTYAVPLNYPNPIDEKSGSSGYGIWLHGTDSEDKLSGKNITKGCIIMENTNINQLVKLIRVMQTPIVISASLKDVKFSSAPTNNTSIFFNSVSKKYKTIIQNRDGLAKTSKVLYEEIK